MNLSEYQCQFLGFLFGETNSMQLPNADVYRFGVEAKAVRAIENSYPTVKTLLGPTVFQGVVVDYLRTIKKQSGDWSDFGWGFPSWIISHRISDQVPYLSDVARLDGYVSRAERRPFDEVNFESFSNIGKDLSECTLILNRGLELFRSTYPIVSIWEAHKSAEPRDTLSFAQAKRMIAKGRGQNALIYRTGWRGIAEAISEKDMAVLGHLREQQSIARAFAKNVLLEKNFAGWLQDMIAKGVIVGARTIH